uniref:Uncharacterized protein n=1 Tax=Romanomermis culicivorax TaxID=13658 RepID=A0A915LAT3_ROMCU
MVNVVVTNSLKFIPYFTPAQPSAAAAKSTASILSTSSTANNSRSNKNDTFSSANQEASAATASMNIGSSSKPSTLEILIDLTEDSDTDEPALIHSTSLVVSKPPLNSNLTSADRYDNQAASCSSEMAVGLSDETESSTFIRESQIDCAVPSNDSIILLTDSPPIPIRHLFFDLKVFLLLTPRHSNVTTPDDPIDHNSRTTSAEAPKTSSSSCANQAPSCVSANISSTNNASIVASQSVSDLLMAAFRNAEFGSTTPISVDAPQSAFVPQSSQMLSPTGSYKKRFKRLLPPKNDRNAAHNQTSFSPYIASSSSATAPLPCSIGGPVGPSATATPIFDFGEYGDHYVQQIYNDVANFQNRFNDFSNKDASAAAQKSCNMAATAASCSYAQINPIGQPCVGSNAYRVTEQHDRTQQPTGFWNRPGFNMSIPNSMAFPSTSYSNIFSTAPQISQYNVNGNSSINSMAKNHLQTQRSVPLPNYQQTTTPAATASGYMSVGFQQQPKNFTSSTTSSWRDFGVPGNNNFYNNNTDYRKYMNNSLRPETGGPEPPGL